MDYFQMICSKNPQKEALVVDGVSYRYGELASLATALGERWKKDRKAHTVRVIKENDILSQLLSFLACYVTGEIPLLVHYDDREFVNGEHLEEISVPGNACMAVATSGTTGRPKIYFRSYESWAGYFAIQNEIFQVTEDSRLFVQGSIAFTGNLNLYMAQFYAGAVIVAENLFQPKCWEARMQAENVNMIYLIPSKLMLLPEVVRQENRKIRMILSGSQSLGREDASRLKKIFPDTRIILYYGASELNYITYVTDENMTDDRSLIGKPFPQVRVEVQNQEIFVHTAWHVEGINCPYSLRDRGHMDGEGNLYFLGRKDDLLNVRGRKVSALRIENALEALPEVREAAVVLENCRAGGQEQLVAYIVPRQSGSANYGETASQSQPGSANYGKTTSQSQSGSANYGKMDSQSQSGSANSSEAASQSRPGSTYFSEPVSQSQPGSAISSEEICRKLRLSLKHYEMPRRIYPVEKLPKNESGKVDKKRLNVLQ